MGMFDDLIPKQGPSQPEMPRDPRSAPAALPGGLVRSDAVGYGLGRSLPRDGTDVRPMPQESGPYVNARPFPEFDFPVPSDTLAAAPSLMTSQDRSGLQSRLRGAVNDVEGAPTLTDLFTAVMGGLEQGQFGTVYDAERYATNPQNWTPEMAPQVTNKPGTMLSRLFGMDDGIPDAVEDRPTGRNTLRMPGMESAAPTPSTPSATPATSGDAASILDQARQAIANGKDPNAVRGRLIEMGIDPANL